MRTIPEILKELEPYTGCFPEAALAAAIEQREAITPELLREVSVMAEDPVGYAAREDCILPVYAIYLLAQFREPRAFAPIVKMLSGSDDTAYELIGGTVTEGLCRILASVYDGNPAPLEGLIENENVDEYVRSAGLTAMAVMVHTGLRTRDEVAAYFGRLFRGKLPRNASFAWDGLVGAVADLPAPELMEEVRRAYAEALTDPSVADLDDIERALVEQDSWRKERFNLITDVMSEMEEKYKNVAVRADDGVEKTNGLPASHTPTGKFA